MAADLDVLIRSTADPLFTIPLAALWSIEVRKTAAEADHARFHTHRRDSSRSFGRLWQMVFGGGR